MRQYDKIMVPVNISEYQKRDERQVSLPILFPTGLVNQMFFFDTKGGDEKGYKALQEQDNVIVMSIEEAQKLFEAGGRRWYEEYIESQTQGEVSVIASDCQQYLKEQGINTLK